MQTEFYLLLLLQTFLSAPITLILALGTPLSDLQLLKISFAFRLSPPFLGTSHGLPLCVCISIMGVAFELHLLVSPQC